MRCTLFADALRRDASAPLLIDEVSRVWTVGQFVQAVQARRDQSHLKERQTIVPLLIHQTADSLIDLFATVESGKIPALIGHRLPESMRADLANTVRAAQAAKVPDLPSVLLFTSGSGGNPKAVLLLHNALAASARAIAAHAAFGSGMRWGAPLPIYHVGGLAIFFRALVSGGTMQLVTDREPLTQLIIDEKLTHCSLVPTQLQRLLDALPVNWRPGRSITLLLGGSALPAPLLCNAASRGFHVLTSYGMTETGSVMIVGSVTPDVDSQQPVATHVLEGWEIRIDQTRELQVKGTGLFAGYLEAGHLQQARSDQDWFSTGDLATNADGVIRIIGRIDSRFKSGGETIYPEMIERALHAIKGISRAVVVPVPDSSYGSRPVAFLQTDEPFSEQTIASWNRQLRTVLPGIMIPIRYFPLDMSGWTLEIKPRRAELARIAEQQISSQ